MMDDFSDWITPEMLVDWAMYDLGYDSSTVGLPDADIKKISALYRRLGNQCGNSSA